MDPDLNYDPVTGTWICVSCAERITFDTLYVDNEGIRWDICKDCGESGYA